jgi:hypothetical protein
MHTYDIVVNNSISQWAFATSFIFFLYMHICSFPQQYKYIVWIIYIVIFISAYRVQSIMSVSKYSVLSQFQQGFFSKSSLTKLENNWGYIITFIVSVNFPVILATHLGESWSHHCWDLSNLSNFRFLQWWDSIKFSEMFFELIKINC